MTLKEFLEYREHRFDGMRDKFCDLNKRYIDGWTDAVKDIRTVLEAHAFDLEIPLD